MSIASASTTIKFHEFPSGQILHNYQPTHGDGSIRSISWSKDGNWLALVPNSGFAEIVSLKDQPKLIHTIHGIEEPSCASFQNTTKRNMAIGTKSGQVLIYDIKTRTVKKRYPRTTSPVIKIEFTAIDNHIVAACDNGEAYIYSNIHNNLSGSFKIPRSQSITSLRTNPIQRSYIAAGSNEGVVAVWDIHRNKNKFFIGSHKAAVTGVAFSPINSDLVVSTGRDRQFCLYDVGANKCIGNIFVENSMTSVEFSPDGKFIVMGSQNGQIYIYDAKSIQKPIHSFLGHDNAIEHLSFRKCEEYETSFLSSEDCKDSNMAVDNCTNNDSVPMDSINGQEKTESACSYKSAEDSFLAILGMNTTSEGSKRVSALKYTPIVPSKLLQDGLHSDCAKLPVTSTPDFLRDDSSLPAVSPVVGQDQTPTILANVEDLVRSAVKQELSEISQNVDLKMKHYWFKILDDINQSKLDLVMVMVKESIKVENYFNNLRETMMAGAGMEENLMLREKIELLEKEIAELKRNRQL